MYDFLKDPDTETIRKLCLKLIGAEIRFNYELKLNDNNVHNNLINNCNIIGDCMENILIPYLQKNIKTIERGPKQKSPDFWNRNRNYEWELKTFKEKPGFDVSNYSSYINQLNQKGGVKRKLFRTQYLIFKYAFCGNYVKILDFKLCNIWNLLLYTGKYPISIQNKRGMWYNIRPCSYSDIDKKEKNPNLLITKLIKSIKECPNNINEKNKIIFNINKQFYEIIYNNCLNKIKQLNIK